MANYHTITKQQAYENQYKAKKAQFEGNLKQYIDEVNDEFNEQWSFTDEPSHYAKTITAWSKKHILLECWNQFVAWEEGFSEYAFGRNAGESLGQRTRIEIVRNFHDYLGGYLEGLEEYNQKVEANAE